MARALIITGFGINCEEETAAAWRLAGAEADVVHLNAVLHARRSIHDYDVITLPGGFSFGDDLGSGKVLSNKIRYRRLPGGRTLLAELERFLGDGKHVLGICNGFQTLVKLGLLPDLAGERTQEATLTTNRSGRFEDRWCVCAVNPRSQSPFLAGLVRLELPVRHAEGRLVFGESSLAARVREQALDALWYVGEDGRPTEAYPANPNGSALAAAALVDPSGQVLGMMPHPEAALSHLNHPDWHARARDGAPDRPGDGLALFQNLVRHVDRTKGEPS